MGQAVYCFTEQDIIDALLSMREGYLTGRDKQLENADEIFSEALTGIAWSMLIVVMAAQNRHLVVAVAGFPPPERRPGQARIR